MDQLRTFWHLFAIWDTEDGGGRLIRGPYWWWEQGEFLVVEYMRANCELMRFGRWITRWHRNQVCLDDNSRIDDGAGGTCGSGHHCRHKSVRTTRKRRGGPIDPLETLPPMEYCGSIIKRGIAWIGQSDWCNWTGDDGLAVYSYQPNCRICFCL